MEPHEISTLDRRCGGDLHVHDKQQPFHPKYRQRLQLPQPTNHALTYLLNRVGAAHQINYLELPLDLTTTSASDAQKLQEFFEVYWVQTHRGKLRVGSYGGTAYSANRGKARNSHTIYSDRPSKVTGEEFCCHLEWRISGRPAVRAAGFESLVDLLEFDHRAFWEKKLRLRAIDKQKLGRICTRTRRRKPGCKKSTPGQPVDIDAIAGAAVIRASTTPNPSPMRPHGSVQEVIDYCRLSLKLNPASALVELPNDQFLPR